MSFPNSYSIYGSLATPVVMMFWLYFCIYIFLIGAFINRFFHPAVKVLYDDHHKKVVRKNVKKKSTKVIRKHRDYNDFG
nr:YhjD/YihY/BrkB family envelope integrity protein [uncultured Butyrivibrio sp.]